MSSAWDRIIRRQQYRFSPRASRTWAGFSPWRVFSTKAGKALPTTLPHVKQRTGMIMRSPVRLLALLACPAPEGLLWQLPAGVRDDQRPVVLPEHGLELFVVQVLDEPAGDRGPDGVRLAHHPASLDVDVDVDRVDLPSCEFQRFEDLEASELELIHLDRDAVDPHDAAHSACGAPALVPRPILFEHDAPPAGHDGLLRVDDDDLLAVQEALRQDGGQTAHHVPGRIDHRHAHPMIRTPDPFGFWTASSRRVTALPPAASIFFRAAPDARKAATVIGVDMTPVARTTPGTTIWSPFAA